MRSFFCFFGVLMCFVVGCGSEGGELNPAPRKPAYGTMKIYDYADGPDGGSSATLADDVCTYGGADSQNCQD